MPTVETTITLTIPEEGVSLGQLEDLVWREVARAARRLLAAGCLAMEERLMATAGAQFRPHQKRGIDLLTRFGWLRLERWQVLERMSGRYRCPLDRVLDLRGGQHGSPWVIQQAVALATRLPYRQATTVLRSFLGPEADLDHRTLYAWVQAEGAAVIEEEDRLQAAVFDDGELPPRDEKVRELVVAEADGTFIKAQREDVPDFEVRLGVLYTGRRLVSKTAKHRRYALEERVLYGGVETAAAFRERFFLAGEARLSLSLARHLLVIGDGADWIEALAGHERWRAAYQLDHWHILHHARLTFTDRPEAVAEIAKALRRGDADRVISLVKLARLTASDPERAARFEAYLQANYDGITGARRLRRHLSRQARNVVVEGSGAIEKQSDLIVSRRFEGQGMRWTRRGAHRLLKLRLRELEAAA